MRRHQTWQNASSYNNCAIYAQSSTVNTVVICGRREHSHSRSSSESAQATNGVAQTAHVTARAHIGVDPTSHDAPSMSKSGAHNYASRRSAHGSVACDTSSLSHINTLVGDPFGPSRRLYSVAGNSNKSPESRGRSNSSSPHATCAGRISRLLDLLARNSVYSRAITSSSHSFSLDTND